MVNRDFFMNEPLILEQPNEIPIPPMEDPSLPEPIEPNPNDFPEPEPLDIPEPSPD